MEKQNRKTYHLSHNDLDGYGAQYITLVAGLNTVYFNCNYGEIERNVKMIKRRIKSEDMLLITDVNLTLDEASFIDNLQKEIGFDLQLLDHHGTGRDVAKLYDWYHLDESKCGTFLTWEHFGKKEDTKLFATIVNDYDLWQEENEHFNKGKALTRIVDEYRYSFPKGLGKKENQFILTALDNAYRMLKEGYSVARMESERYSTERKLFLEDNQDNEELTLHEVKIENFTDKIMAMNPKPYTVVRVDGYTAYVFTGLSKIFQIFSNKILNENDDLHIAVNISNRGFMSLRSREKDIDLGQISKKYFGGGGHPQAAGGSLGLEDEKLKDKELVQRFIDIVNGDYVKPKKIGWLKSIWLKLF